MRCIFALSPTMMLAGAALAAAGGPDGYGYYYNDSNSSGPAYDSGLFIDAVSSGTMLTTAANSDDSSQSVTLPFTFTFYGVDYTTAYVNANGYISFGNSTSGTYSYSNTDFATSVSSSYPSYYPLVAPFHDDLYYSAGTTYIYAYTEGESPDRVYTVAWYRSHFSYTSGYVEFAARLYETTNDIVFQYKDVVFGSSAYDYGRSATVGINAGEVAGNYTQLSFDSASYLTTLTSGGATGGAVALSSGRTPYLSLLDGTALEGVPTTLSPAYVDWWSTYSYGVYDCEGDGTWDDYSSSTSLDCTYPDQGSYETSAAAVSALGTYDIATATMTVYNVAPTPESGSGQVNGVLTFDYDASLDLYAYVGSGVDEGSIAIYDMDCTATDVPADTVTITHDWGDGNTTESAPGERVEHTYVDEGTYRYTCTPSDEDGGIGDELWEYFGIAVFVVVDNVAPTIEDVVVDAGDEGEVTSFQADVTDPGVEDVLTYAWDFGDGTTGSGAAPEHIYDAPGTYAWTLDVDDGDGGSARMGGTVVIADVPPTIVSLALAGGLEGSPLSMSATVTAGVDDTVTYAWDFGDGATSTAAAPSHAYADNGTYTVTLSVTDDDSTSVSRSGAIVVTNADPVASITAPASPSEGAPASFVGGVTDPGTADTHTFAWDFGDGGTSSAQSPTHSYADDGSYIVTLIVTDDDGGSDTAVRVVTVGGTAPTITTLAEPGPLDEGSEGTVVAAASDPSGDSLAYAWSFADGGTASTATAAHTWVQDGTYTVTLVVTDEDGDAATASFEQEVRNVAPVVEDVADQVANEGDLLSFAGVATDVGAEDVLTYAWSFGEGGSGSGESPTYTYGDDGTFVATLVVTDDGGGSDTTTFTVVVANVAPTITSTAATAADEGVEYAYAPTFTDPGAGDTHAWTLDEAPSGAAIDPFTGEVSWTPTYAECGTEQAFAVTVFDDDGGSDTETWTVVAVALDTDGDGMADGYEDEVGFDKYDASDADEDADGDGISNGDEAADGTDPFVYDGPGVPVAVSPIDGEDASSTPDLVVTNTTSGRDEPIVYYFDVYDSPTATVVLTESDAVGEGTATTSWNVDLTLAENTWYYWEAKAADSHVSSAFTEREAFFVNDIEEAPTDPVAFSPVEGETVATPTPNLAWVVSEDPEGGAITYTVQTWDATGTTLVDESVVSDDGADSYADALVKTVLSEDTWYQWTVQATDDAGMTSAWSAPEVFLVSTEDGAPSDPSWVSPVDGEEIVELDPVLTWTASVDPEGTAVSYAVEGDVVASFDSAALVSVAVAATGAGTDSVDLSGAGIELPENVPVFLRVRGTDAAGLSSAWAVVEVFSRGDNDAPGVPELISPEEGTQVEEGTPELVCAVVNDAEADEVRYEIMVSTTPDTAGRVTGADDLVAGADVRWQVEIDLGDGIYYWSARASDDRGGTSAWAELRSFVVGDGTPGTGDSGGGDTGPVDDTTGGDQVGEEEPAEDVGCGCAGAGRVAIAWLGVGLAAAGARRRRV